MELKKMNNCDKCGLADPECQCYLYEIDKRVCALEEGLDQLTNVVKHISDYIRKSKDG